MHEFEKKLRKAGVLRKFKRNMKDCFGKVVSFEFYCTNYDKEGFHSFVGSAFVWADTPEGHEYWYDIAKM